MTTLEIDKVNTAIHTKIKVGLDRMVLGIPYPRLSKTDVDKPPSQDQLIALEHQRKEFVATMKHIINMIEIPGQCHCAKTQNKDLRRYHVLSANGALVCVFSLGFTFGVGVINLEINPSKMSADKWGELLALLSVSFDGHYAEFYDRCVVAHAEFYVDISDEQLANLVLIDEGRRTTTKFKGTTYHGKKGSRLVGTMYDKAKEQKQNGLLVRIEIRINRR